MKKGLTLIETIIYIAILGMVSTSFMIISLNLISLKTKSIAQQEVAANLRFISARINYEIRNSHSIVASSSNSLTLPNSRVIDFNNGNIRYGIGISGNCPISNPCNLNSNLVDISNFTLANLSTGDSRSQNIQYSFTVTYKNNTQSGSVRDSIELR